MTMFVTSQSFISLPSFMIVSAAVSEIHDLNQNKEEKNNGYFQLTTFPRHITDPFFTTVTKKSSTPQTESDNWNFLKYTHNARNQGHPYTQYYCTV